MPIELAELPTKGRSFECLCRRVSELFPVKVQTLTSNIYPNGSTYVDHFAQTHSTSTSSISLPEYLGLSLTVSALKNNNIFFRFFFQILELDEYDSSLNLSGCANHEALSKNVEKFGALVGWFPRYPGSKLEETRDFLRFWRRAM
jgi:hypothetical protein